MLYSEGRKCSSRRLDHSLLVERMLLVESAFVRRDGGHKAADRHAHVHIAFTALASFKVSHGHSDAPSFD